MELSTILSIFANVSWLFFGFGILFIKEEVDKIDFFLAWIVTMIFNMSNLYQIIFSIK
jgi:hypothetical protein